MEAKFKLIDGEFSVGEAKDIIGNLLEFKIQYHSKQNFGSEIRTGVSDQKSLSRKENLKATKIQFLSFLEEMSDTDIISIHSEISIKK
jgi:hypothetical protein